MGLRARLDDLSEPTIRERPIGVLVIAVVSLIVGITIALATLELFLGAAQYGEWTKPKLVGNDLVGMVKVYPEHYILMGSMLSIPALYTLALPVGINSPTPVGWDHGICRRRPHRAVWSARAGHPG